MWMCSSTRLHTFTHCGKALNPDRNYNWAIVQKQKATTNKLKPPNPTGLIMSVCRRVCESVCVFEILRLCSHIQGPRSLMMSRRLTEYQSSVVVVDGGLRPGPECTASTHSVKQMVVVKEVGAASAVIGRASRAVSETEPQQRDALPGCVYACVWVCKGDFSVGGCQGLPIQRVAVPTHEGMCGKKCVTHEGRSVFSFLSECWSYQDSPQNFTIFGGIPVGKSQTQNNNITFQFGS